MPVTLNISLTQKMRDFIDRRVADGDYASASDYIRCLLREDSKRHLDELLMQGLAAGPGRVLDEKGMEALAKEMAATIEQAANETKKAQGAA
jgi:antitoxin ParD1/3/4